MKCRKCGHQIEVRAAVTETSVSTSPPRAMGSAARTRRARVAKSSLATSLSAAKPRAPVGHSPKHQLRARSRVRSSAPSRTRRGPEVPFPQQTGGLELSVTDEWYVAINGVPVGPVRISELRRKAASGAVTEESLCWQEGLEEWRPVRSIPELAAIVREAAQGNRPSLVSPPHEGQDRGSRPPPAPQRPAPPPPRGPEPPRPPERARRSSRRVRPSPSRSNVVPLRVAASSNVDEAPPSPIGSPLSGLGRGCRVRAVVRARTAIHAGARVRATGADAADARAASSGADGDQRSRSPCLLRLAQRRASLLPPAPFAPSSPRSSSRSRRPSRDGACRSGSGRSSSSPACSACRRRSSSSASRQPPPPVVIQMPATATPTPTATEAKNDVPPPPTTGERRCRRSAPSRQGRERRVREAGGGAAAAHAGEEERHRSRRARRRRRRTERRWRRWSRSRPAAAVSTPRRSSASSPQHRTGVKRTCWERGGADQKASVNVTVSATVAPDGSVVGHLVERR